MKINLNRQNPLIRKRGQTMAEWAIVASASAMAFAGLWGLKINEKGETSMSVLLKAFEDAFALLSMAIAFP